MAEIVLKNIVKKYGDLVAVNDLCLDIRDREFIVLLGPSGCGKTTTLRCISGLEIPTQGNVYLDGEDVTDRRASKRDIAFVFQLYALYPHMSVYKNIAFPLKTQRVKREEIHREVKKAAQILQIQHILNKRPKELSGGDMQRVALGRALVRKPKVFLLDEPIGTLDAKFREEMRTELKRLHVDIGATTVYVTHDQVEAMSMGDRIAILDQGVLQQVGEPHEVYLKPANLFVANFIGSPGMNFIKCKTHRDSNGKIGLQLTSTGDITPIPDGLQQQILDRNEVEERLVLGVRPEDVIITDKKKSKYIGTEVYLQEKIGSYSIIDVKLSEEVIRTRTLPTFTPSIGDGVFISFEMSRITIFDEKTGKAIAQ